MTSPEVTSAPAEQPPGTAGDDGGSRRHSNLVAAGILLSRIFGFLRERAVSHFLGLSFAADAFTAAFRIPNLMQNLLGEGVLSASFIPVYARLLDQGREEEAGRVAGAVLGLLTVAVGVLAVVGVVFAGPIMHLILPGAAEQTVDLAVTLMQIMTPGIALLVLSAWCLGILNSHRRFFLSYVAPVLWNVAQITAIVAAGVVLLDDVMTPGAADADTITTLATALSVGTLVGGLLQLAAQVPAVLRLTGGLRPTLNWALPGVRRTLRAFGPIVAGRGGVQLMAFLDVVLASLLAGGALAALYKAQMLYVLPISLFGMSVAAAELPDLSTARMEVRGTLRRRLSAGLERIAFYVTPTVVGFVLLGDIIVGALFLTGSFDPPDVTLVWLILVGFCVGLLATTSSRLLQSALYGAGDTRGPATLAVVRVAGSALLGYALMLQLDRVVIGDGSLALMADAALPAFSPLPAGVRTDPAFNHLGAVGLSLGTGVFGWVEYRLLRELLDARAGVRVSVGGGAMGRIVASAAVAAVAAIGCRFLVGGWHPIAGAAVAVPVTAAAYLITADQLGLGETAALRDNARELVSRLRS